MVDTLPLDGYETLVDTRLYAKPDNQDAECVQICELERIVMPDTAQLVDMYCGVARRARDCGIDPVPERAEEPPHPLIYETPVQGFYEYTTHLLEAVLQENGSYRQAVEHMLSKQAGEFLQLHFTRAIPEIYALVDPERQHTWPISVYGLRSEVKKPSMLEGGFGLRQVVDVDTTAWPDSAPQVRQVRVPDLECPSVYHQAPESAYLAGVESTQRVMDAIGTRERAEKIWTSGEDEEIDTTQIRIDSALKQTAVGIRNVYRSEPFYSPYYF